MGTIVGDKVCVAVGAAFAPTARGACVGVVTDAGAGGGACNAPAGAVAAGVNPFAAEKVGEDCAASAAALGATGVGTGVAASAIT